MTSISASSMARGRARLRSYATRRHAFLFALGMVHLGLLLAAGWLVVAQVGAGPMQVLTVGLLGLIAMLVLLSPGSAAALVFILGCGGCYLVLSALESEVGGSDRVPQAYQVLALAAALFLVHAVDSLRETLPAEASIEAAVLIRWVRRVAEALVPGLLVGGLLVVLPTASVGGVLWLVGAVGLLLAVGLPALALRPRPWRDDDHQDR